MQWNWQRRDWPNFTYDSAVLEPMEREFLHGTGLLFGAYGSLEGGERDTLKVQIISDEAFTTSRIEGEHLDRDSLQSSIRRHFGLQTPLDPKQAGPKERGIARMMFDLYTTYAEAIGHRTLYRWHRMLTLGRSDLEYVGRYRGGEDAMRVVSGPIHDPVVHFEAPPAGRVKKEMDGFVRRFNRWSPGGASPLPALTRAGTAHLYFESIHPFEDGNGRIGRALSEKTLAQALGAPSLVALAATIDRNRKAYYAALAGASRKNEITGWLVYFAETALAALRYTRLYIEFLTEKNRLLNRLRGRINKRQEKCLLRMFREGPEGFRGGLSAKNYTSITGASPATATRDLADLVKKGALVKTGELKSTRYHIPKSWGDRR